ncbi:MAG: DnaT-like ssDNA-binding domain-containing protein [Congregibacter sp.]
MSLSHLLPDSQLVFSAELAAAAGLEEAVMLQQLRGLYLHQPATQREGLSWLHISEAYLLQLLPFWDVDAVRRICRSLETLGLICLDQRSAASECLLLAINHRAPGAKGAPDASAQPSTMVTPARDTSVVYRSSAAQVEPLVAAARTITTNSNTSKNTGDSTSTDTTTNTNVSNNVSNNVSINASNNASTGAADSGRAQPPSKAPPRREGQPLPLDFQPSEDNLEILEQFHGIPRDFALQQLEDFMLYWRERGSAAHAWQNKFKQHVQFKWAKFQQDKLGGEHAGQQGTGKARRTRDSSLEQDLTDTSWAE